MSSGGSGGDDKRPLLGGQPGSYGSAPSSPSKKTQPIPTEPYYAEEGGYQLSPDGLALIVSQRQLGALSAFGGVAELARNVGCDDLKTGLPSDDDLFLKRQRDKYGTNSLPPPPSPSLFGLILQEAQDPTILMLLASAAVSLVLGLGIEKDFEHGWIEGTSIMVTVCLVIGVSSVTDYAKGKEFREQQERLESSKSVNVVRSGSSRSLHPRELVVGDVIRLAVGDIAPVDGLIVDGSDLKFDESALTGETNLIEKTIFVDDRPDVSDLDPFVVSGTNVMQGSGKLLVVAVGVNSIQGRILARIREQEESGGAKDDDDGGEREPAGCLGRIKNFFTFGHGDDGADLMEKLNVLAVDIGKVGLIVAGAVFVVMLVAWCIEEFAKNGPCPRYSTKGECLESPYCRWSKSEEETLHTCLRKWSEKDISTILDYFITAVTILVVAVPEGLPLAVTLALAVSVRRMIKDNNQVKHMDSCETMGSATTICSDKTGTLTENKMTAMRICAAGAHYRHVVGKSGDADNLGEVIRSQSDENRTLIELISEAILLNCAPTSKVIPTESGVIYEGNATECALIKLTQQLGSDDADAFREKFKEPDSMLDWGVHGIPFSSERKRMSWIVRRDSGFRMYSKGAPKALFAACQTYLSDATPSGDTTVLPFDDDAQKTFQETISGYQNSGLRTLAIAYRDFDAVPPNGWSSEADNENLESEMTLLAVFGIEDPLRPSVPSAIEDCRKAGIDVRMCTGDALTTAIAIARGCGILRPSDCDANGKPKVGFAMTGAEFDDRVHKKNLDATKAVRRVFDAESNDAIDKLADPFLLDDDGNKILDQTAFDDLWPTLRVLARCQPEDKLALVRGMRRSKVFMDERRVQRLAEEHNVHIFPDFQVVAVTGDGTNDAPALKSANVGFAMGIVGTETAKQACDIILLDDNFSSIVKAVMWGRNVFDSISKFLQFQLTVNVVAITLAVVGAFTYAESPLSAVQMLWVNMIMDSLASLALATELPTEELLDRMPYGRRRPVISHVMWSNIIGHASYQIGMLLWVLFAPSTIPFLDPPVEFEPTQGSLHWSLFFNVFVMLQLFNEFNSRRLQMTEKLRTTWSEWNVFRGVCANPMFVGVMVTTFSLQAIIVRFGGVAVNVVPGGLSADQWTFSVAAGAGGLVWQLVINVVIAFFLETSAEEEKKSCPPPSAVHLEEAKFAETTAKHWDHVRLGVRQGFLYQKMFDKSFNTGFKIASIARTKRQAAEQEKLSVDLAKEISSRRIVV